jgi:hypothetical protein
MRNVVCTSKAPGVGPYSQAESFLTLRNLLRPTGTMVSVVSSPDIYKHEWASSTTKEFPENLEGVHFGSNLAHDDSRPSSAHRTKPLSFQLRLCLSNGSSSRSHRPGRGQRTSS